MNLRDQLRHKIILEERFRREVRRLFNRIRIEFRIGISTRSIKRAANYNPRWVVLLENHYTRVQKTFRGVVKNDEKQNEQENNDEVSSALLLWAFINSIDVARAITNTNQRNMDDAIAQARQAFSDEGNTSYTTRELAALSAIMLNRKFRGRETSIIITETQRAAESTKLIEAFGEAGLPPDAVVTQGRVPVTNAIKEWVDVGDKDVRRGHHAGEVASVSIDRPFIVNGQQLMYPGDNSRGAAVGNTINCRCGSFYTFN
jgi:hypothetical protein